MKNNAPLVNFRRLSVPTPWWLVMWVVVPLLAWRLGRGLVRLVPVVARNFGSLTLLGLGLWTWHRFGWLVLVLVLVAVLGVVGGWWWRWRDSCERLVVLPVLSWWRRLFVYRLHWREALTTCGLAERFDGQQSVPKLLRVRCSYATDEVLLRMPRGQEPGQYHKASTVLAHSFNSRHCRVFSRRPGVAPVRNVRLVWLRKLLTAGRLSWLLWLVTVLGAVLTGVLRLADRVKFRDRPRLVWLVFIRRDPLTRTVPALPVPARPDFSALAVAMREDLEVWLLRLLATHLLIVGATRSGKGSVQWSLIRALASAIRSGLVQLWGIDPKGGMELSIGSKLFARYEYREPAAMVGMTEELVTIMRERQDRLQGKSRVHTPTVDEPLYVLMVDELLALLVLVSDPELRTRARNALLLLLTQGAGLGILVVAATQDPRKEVLDLLRDFFPTRIALRLNEQNHVDLALGEGSRNRGALCDLIPNDARHKGIGYVVLDDQPEPARVRFAYVTDDEIEAMAELYAAPVRSSAPPAKPAPTGKPRQQPRQHTYRPSSRAAGPLLPDSLLNLVEGDTA